MSNFAYNLFNYWAKRGILLLSNKQSSMEIGHNPPPPGRNPLGQNPPFYDGVGQKPPRSEAP